MKFFENETFIKKLKEWYEKKEDTTPWEYMGVGRRRYYLYLNGKSSYHSFVQEAAIRDMLNNLRQEYYAD